jgi:hypothetical protein
MSIDPAFLARIERLYPGRDYLAPLTHAARARLVEREVRARQRAHGRPHEPLQHDVRPVLHGRQPGRLRPRARVGRDQKILDDSLTIQPRRQMSVQFSGGEPTLSPHFLRPSSTPSRAGTSACSARPTASASRRSPSSRSRRRRRAAPRVPPVRRRHQRGQLAPQGGEPLRREAPRHREPARRGDRRRARGDGRERRQRRAGRPDHRFRVANADKITVVSFQPVSFTGRDEDISDECARSSATR